MAVSFIAQLYEFTDAKFSKVQRAMGKVEEVAGGVGKSGSYTPKSNSAQGFSTKGYNPQLGERTLEGFVKQNARPEVALYTKYADFE